MPAVKRRWTAREVRELIDQNPLASPRYELVDGELLVTPSPNAMHQNAVYLLQRALNDYVDPRRLGHAFASPLDVDLESQLVVQPDVLVVPMHEFERLRHEMPVRELIVVAEVLSKSSGRFDRVDKRVAYLRHVTEYWIVDLDDRLFERWQPNDDRPRILVDELDWHLSGAAEPFRLELPRFFAEVFGD